MLSEIFELLDGKLTIPRVSYMRKAIVIDYVIANRSSEVLEEISRVIKGKTQHLKRKRNDEQNCRRTATRCEVGEEERDPSRSLELPNVGRVKECYREFYAATSNDAIAVSDDKWRGCCENHNLQGILLWTATRRQTASAFEGEQPMCAMAARGLGLSRAALSSGLRFQVVSKGQQLPARQVYASAWKV
jgi:hypothetical protein